MQSLLPLYSHLLLDASRWCVASTTRDLETITRRSKHEGDSFFTITLPNFCREFERALDIGYVASSDFPSFRKFRALPRFLGGLLRLIFDLDSGLLVSDPDPNAIYFIRQITLMCKKMELECTPERVQKAFQSYEDCEREVQHRSRGLSRQLIADFDRARDLLWGRDLGIADFEVYNLCHVPKHGPGATADRVRGNEKYVPRAWNRRLEENFFPSCDFLIPNYGYYESLQCLDYTEPGAEVPSRVISVPKTQKTPRIIAIEPVCMQYAQQALLEVLARCLTTSSILNGMIGLDDQRPNQELARVGSIDRSIATIDLSEASDRVSLRIAARLLQPFPSLLRAVMACRSKRAVLPSGKVLYLSKFASMGSALCFPIEAMVFLTIVFVAISKELNRPLTRGDVYHLSSSVRVFGDDIVVPKEFAIAVSRELEAYGLKVNVNKSFWNGYFRESCGEDWYRGKSVKPAYLGAPIPRDRRNASEFAAFVAFRNLSYENGLWSVTQYCDGVLERLAPFPLVDKNSPILGRISFCFSPRGEIRGDLQKLSALGVTLKGKTPNSPLNEHWALQKYFLKRGILPFFDKYHLECYGRPDSVHTKVGWGPVIP